MTYQKNQFLALMQNYNQALKLQADETNASGSAQNRYQTYLKSTESQLNKAKNAMQMFWMGTMNSDTINSVISGFTKFINTLMMLSTTSKSSAVALIGLSTAIIALSVSISNLGFAGVSAKLSSFIAIITSGVGTAIKSIESLIAFFKLLPIAMAETGGMSALLSTAFGGLATSIIEVNAALLLNPLTWVIATLAIATTAVVQHVKHQADLKQETQDLTLSYQDLTKAMKDNNVEGMKSASIEAKKEQSNLQALISNQTKAKEELDKAMKNLNSSPTNVGYQMAAQSAQLAYDNTTKKVKEQEKAIKDSGYTIDEATGKIKELGDAESSIKIDTAIEKVKQSIEKRKEEDNSLSGLIDKYNNLSSVQNKNTAQQMEMSNIANTLHNKYSDLTLSVDKNGNAIITNTNLLGTKKEALAEDIQAITKDADAQVMQGLRAEKIQVGNTEMTIGEIEKRIEAYRAEAEAANGGQGSEYVDAKQMQMIQAYDGIQDKLKALKQSVTSTSSEIGDNYTPNVEKNTGKTKENKEAQDALSESIKKVANEMKSYENQIKAVDNALYALDSQMQGMDETSDDYINALKQQNDMFSQRISLVNGATQANNGYMSSIGSMSGVSGSALGQQVVQAAEGYLGVQYKYGGKDSSGIDCSGLVSAAYKQIGIDLSGSTYDQINKGSSVSKNQLQAGDLVFFGTSDDPHHVGMYVGNDNFIEAPHTGSQVKISSLANRSDYLTARRVISSDSYNTSSAIGSNGAISTGGTVGGFNDTNSFVQAALPLANAILQKYNVLPSVTLAQAIEESGGTSKEAKEDNNYFGMTWTENSGKQKGNARPKDEGGNYVHYNNLAESMDDYAKLLAKWGVGGQSFSEAMNTLTNHGYATDGNYANEVNGVRKTYGLDKYDSGTVGGIANLSDTGMSKIEDILSKNEDYAKQNIDYQRKILENNTKIYEAYNNRYDKQVSEKDKQLNLDKENYTYYEKDSNSLNDSSRQYMQKEYEDINAKNAILIQKQNFIENQMKNNIYDEKTSAQMKSDLLDVDSSIKKNLNDLHQAFKDWLADRLTYKTQGFTDNLESSNSQLSLLNEKDSNGFSAEKVSLNKQILEQERLKGEAIKEQARFIQDLYDKEQFGVTRQLWKKQLEDLKKTQIENQTEIEKSINTLRDAKISEILDDVDKRLKKINQDLKDIETNSKDVGDSNTSQKLINEMNKASDYVAQLEEYTKAYNDIYKEVSKDGVISTDDQKKIDDARSKIDSVNDALQTTKLNINSLKLENAIVPFSNAISLLINNVSKLDYQLKMLGTTDYSGKVDVINQQLGYNKTKQNSLMDEYNQLINQPVTPGTKEADEYKKSLETVRDAMIQASEEGKTLKESLQDASLSSLFQEIQKPQDKVTQQISNIDFETSMGQNKGLALGNNFIDTTDQYKTDTEKQLEESQKVSDAVDNINSKISDLTANTYDIDTSSITNTMENTTSTTNTILKNINDSINVLAEKNNKSIETKNVYGTGTDLSNAQALAQNYGIEKLFKFIDTNADGFLWSEHKVTKNDIALGGTGGGVNGDVELNGADRLGGKDRDDTRNLIDEYMKSLISLLKNDNNNSIGKDTTKTNEELINKLDLGNTTSSTIANNTEQDVSVTNVQTATLTKTEEDTTKLINDNINSNFVTLEELIRNVKDSLTSIKDVISSIKDLETTDLGQIISSLKFIDTKTIIQELINLHGSVNSLGETISNGLSNADKIVSFNGTSAVELPDYSGDNKDKKEVNKKANGGGTTEPWNITGEEGEEGVILPSGQLTTTGKNGWTLQKFPIGSTIIKHNDFEKIKRQGGIKETSKYASGTQNYRVFAKSSPPDGDYENAYDYINNKLGSQNIKVIDIDKDNNITSNDYVLGTELTIPNSVANGAKRIDGGIDRKETYDKFINWVSWHNKIQATEDDIKTTTNTVSTPLDPNISSTSDYSSTSSSSNPTSTGIDIDNYTKLDNTAYRQGLNSDINNIQSAYTSQIQNGASDTDLYKNEISLQEKSILLNNDAISQLKQKEILYAGNADALKKITDEESNLSKQMQESQKRITDIAKQAAESITAITDAENKQLETSIKLVGSTSTKSELENDKRKAEILKDQTVELENQNEAYKNIVVNEDLTLRRLNDFNSTSLTSDQNSQLKDLLNKQAQNGYLSTSDQQSLSGLELKLSAEDKTKLLSITELLSAIYNKKTDVQITIQNQKDAIASQEYESAQQVIQNKKSLDEAQFSQDKKDWSKSLFNVSESEFNQYKTNKIAQDQKDMADSQSSFSKDPTNLYYLDEIQAKQNDIANTQKENYSDIYNWEETFEKVHEQRISQLEKENELETEKENNLKDQNDLLKLQKELMDLLNNKTVMTYVKDKDGNWQKKYVADQTAVDSKQAEIAEKMRSNADTLKQQEIAKEKQYESDLINTQKAAYEKLVNDQQNILTNKYSDMNFLTEEYLRQIRDQAGNNDTIVQAILAKGVLDSQTKLDTFIANVNGKVKEMTTFLQGLATDIVANSKKDEQKSTGTTTVPSIIDSPEYKAIQQAAGKAAAAGDQAGLDKAGQDARNLLDKNGIKYKTGGLNTKTGIAQLDGTANKPEYVLNPNDTDKMFNAVDVAKSMSEDVFKADDILNNLGVNFSNMMSNIPLNTNVDYAMPNINKPSVNMANFNKNSEPQSIQQNINIKADFPNANNCIEIEKAFSSMEGTARQYLNKK